jgi:hypothetical protein
MLLFYSVAMQRAKFEGNVLIYKESKFSNVALTLSSMNVLMLAFIAVITVVRAANFRPYIF